MNFGEFGEGGPSEEEMGLKPEGAPSEHEEDKPRERKVAGKISRWGRRMERDMTPEQLAELKKIDEEQKKGSGQQPK